MRIAFWVCLRRQSLYDLQTFQLILLKLSTNNNQQRFDSLTEEPRLFLLAMLLQDFCYKCHLNPLCYYSNGNTLIELFFAKQFAIQVFEPFQIHPPRGLFFRAKNNHRS